MRKLLAWFFSRRRANTIALKGHYRFIFRDALTDQITRVSDYDNVICANGEAYIAAWMNQEAGYGANPTIYGAIGTGAGTPNRTDTQLFSEVSSANVGRVALASSSRSGNALTSDFFWTTAQGNSGAAVTEAGVFLGGSATTNSGQLLSHVLISENKTSTETLTVEFTLTVGP